MNTELSLSSEQMTLMASTIVTANRIGDSTLRGMFKLSRLNSEALVRSVDEQGIVSKEVQNSDPGEAASLQRRSAVAGGTKFLAYSVHVANIYFETASEIAIEYGKLYKDALRAAVSASQFATSATTDESSASERAEHSILLRPENGSRDS
jgi:hypothetical protein